MKKEKYTISYTKHIISLICVAIISLAAGYIYFNSIFQREMANLTMDGNLRRIQRFYREIEENYFGEVQMDDIAQAALQGMSDALGDPYSSFLTDEENQRLQETMQGSFGGIGASIGLIHDRPTIAAPPEEDSPAGQAGIQEGDVIISVDGNSVEGQTVQEIVGQIRGEIGTKVVIGLERADEVKEVTVTRGSIPIRSVRYQLDEQNKQIGYIQIGLFNQTTTNEVKSAVENLRKEGATSFILDLRQNPGGLLEEAVNLSSMFLEDGKVIVQYEDRNGRTTQELAGHNLDNGFKVTEPVVVLVDARSASAAEIFAAALKESGDALVVGPDNTLGKGTVQSVRNLDRTSGVRMTVLKWLTPSGHWVNNGGLTPSIIETNDPYKKAVELLLGE